MSSSNGYLCSVFNPSTFAMALWIPHRCYCHESYNKLQSSWSVKNTHKLLIVFQGVTESVNTVKCSHEITYGTSVFARDTVTFRFSAWSLRTCVGWSAINMQFWLHGNGASQWTSWSAELKQLQHLCMSILVSASRAVMNFKQHSVFYLYIFLHNLSETVAIPASASSHRNAMKGFPSFLAVRTSQQLQAPRTKRRRKRTRLVPTILLSQNTLTSNSQLCFFSFGGWFFVKL